MPKGDCGTEEVDTLAGGLSFEGVRKRFHRREVLSGLDLEVPRGSTVVLLGANGAGKTTLVRIAATLDRPDGGRVLIGGWDVAEAPEEARALMGVVSHQPLVYGELSARENLVFFSRLYGADVAAANGRAEELLELMGLASRADDKARGFSRGMLQRLSLARALAHDPPVLLLDEPFTGLDAHAEEGLASLLSDLGDAGKTVLLTGHDPRSAAGLGDAVAVLAGGRIALLEDAGDLGDDFPARYRELISGGRG